MFWKQKKNSGTMVKRMRHNSKDLNKEEESKESDYTALRCGRKYG